MLGWPISTGSAHGADETMGGDGFTAGGQHISNCLSKQSVKGTPTTRTYGAHVRSEGASDRDYERHKTMADAVTIVVKVVKRIA